VLIKRSTPATIKTISFKTLGTKTHGEIIRRKATARLIPSGDIMSYSIPDTYV
jgi:hypothetical protein